MTWDTYIYRGDDNTDGGSPVMRGFGSDMVDERYVCKYIGEMITLMEVLLWCERVWK